MRSGRRSKPLTRAADTPEAGLRSTRAWDLPGKWPAEKFHAPRFVALPALSPAAIFLAIGYETGE